MTTISELGPRDAGGAGAAQTGEGRALLRLAEATRRVAQLCDLLEAIADDLPRRIKPIWREVARLCSTVVPRHYEDMAQVLLPVLSRRKAGDPDCAAVLARLQADYAEDALRLPDLSELLSDAADSSGARLGAEALGFALRSFFQTLRRQVLWEEDVLFPLARRALTADDLSEISLGLDRGADILALPLANRADLGRG